MDIKELEKSLMKEWAVKAMEALSDEAKQNLITSAIYLQLDKMDFNWQVQDIFKDYALNYANQVISEKAFQMRIKAKVNESMDSAFDAVIKELSKDILSRLKWSVERAADNLKSK